MRHGPIGRGRIAVAAMACLGVVGAAASGAGRQVPDPPPLGLDLYMPAPVDNPVTAAKTELGERLFFDSRLSADWSLSCASCHRPDRAFTDGRPQSRGVHGRRTARSAPSILNAGYGTSFFWDGRTSTLEEQVLRPITASEEMGAALPDVVARVAGDAGYRDAFREAFDADVSETTLARALATFVRTRRSAASAYDRHVAGDMSAMSAEAIAGLRLFQGKAGCVECHFGPLLTGGRFHNTGVGWGGQDVGRMAVTGREQDRGRFKTPTLRNVALTAPYMHDGSLATLEDVIEFYTQGGHANPNLDPRLRPLSLAVAEKRQLVAYLLALTSQEYITTAGDALEGQVRQRHILFSSDRTGRPEVYALTPAEAGSIRRLTYTTGADAQSDFAVWSPDGRRIAFVLTAGGNADIAVMAADGSNVRRLTTDAGADLYPAWSPDGRRIAFVSDRDGNREIYVMNADGSDQRNLTRHPAFDSRPAWSPDGQRILFGSDRGADGRAVPNLYVMHHDGTDVRRLTDHPRADMIARFSPDGRSIVFASNRDGNQQVYVMNADGSGVRRLTHTAETNGGPAWSPDGEWIVFNSNRDGNPEIYVMRTEGTEARRLTFHTATEVHPFW